MADIESNNQFATNSNDDTFNPSEFIDIHRGVDPEKVLTNQVDSLSSSKSQAADFCSETGALNKNISSSNSDKENTSVPVQETIGSSDSLIRCDNRNVERRENNDCCSDEEEYASAEEGQDLACESDSDEEFVPVSDEEKNLQNVEKDFDSIRLDQTSDKDDPSDAESISGKSDSDQELGATEQQKEADELEVRKREENLLTAEEKQERKDRAQTLKNDGNVSFRQGDYDEAIAAYTEALNICPLEFHKERSIMFANRAACKMKQEFYEAAIKDSSEALELHPHYIKAMLRRAELYEKTEKLDEALKDYQKVVELDPTQHAARAACMSLVSS